jgi:hypothetical protein
MGERLAWGLSLGAFAALAPSPTIAEECDAQDWFCEDAVDVEHAEADTQAPEAASPESRPSKRREAERPSTPPRSCEVEPARRVVVRVEVACAARSPEQRQPENGRPEPEDGADEDRREQTFRSFGIGVLGQGLVAVGPRAEDGRTVGGLGLQMRWRPEPSVALDVGVVGMGGAEYRGATRGEAVGFLDLIIYPTEDALRPYFLAGGELAFATSVWRGPDSYDRSETYEYVAPRGGMGVELEPVEGVALFLDGVFAPRFPTNGAARRELAGADWRATVAIRSGVLAWW